MKVKAFLDKRVIDKIFEVYRKRPDQASRLLDFVFQCDELSTYEGMWEKDQKKIDYYRIIGSSGHTIKKLPASTDFQDALQDTGHFSLSITTNERKPSLKAHTPLLSIEEVLQLLDDSKQTAFYIKNQVDFIPARVLHQPTSLIINDRYFFESKKPADVITIILENLLNSNYNAKIVITVFCCKPIKKQQSSYYNYNVSESTNFEDLILESRKILQKQLSEQFPALNFTLEFIENKSDAITHDRFIFTDLMCYKSEKSFQFLLNSQTTVMHRYLIFDGMNFITNVIYLSEFLRRANIPDLNKSSNPIIQSFLNKKHYKTVI